MKFAINFRNFLYLLLVVAFGIGNQAQQHQKFMITGLLEWSFILTKKSLMCSLNTHLKRKIQKSY